MTTPITDDDEADVAANLARLEAALARIAAHARPAQASGVAPPDSAILADRLDGMIARLRAELGE